MRHFLKTLAGAAAALAAAAALTAIAALPFFLAHDKTPVPTETPDEEVLAQAIAEDPALAQILADATATPTSAVTATGNGNGTGTTAAGNDVADILSGLNGNTIAWLEDLTLYVR